MTVGANLSRQRNRRGAAAAADIENALAGLRAGACDQPVGDRRKQDVLHGLPLGPVLARNPVPECDLIGVLIVAGWWGSLLSMEYSRGQALTCAQAIRGTTVMKSGKTAKNSNSRTLDMNEATDVSSHVVPQHMCAASTVICD